MSAEQFTSILKRGKIRELVPFLKTLDNHGRKEVGNALKQLAKEYLEYKLDTSLTGNSYKQKATPDQVQIIYATGFVVYNRKDYQKLDTGYFILTNIFINEILIWKCPEWFSDYVNDMTKREWMPWTFTYEVMMTLMEGGYLQPTDELVARLIPEMIFVRNEKHQHVFTPQNLVKRKITCEQHIWLIFSYETTINHADRYYDVHISNKEEKRWLTTLKRYTDNGAIDRQRLLKESLLATCKNFTKPLSGWFVELFELMEPTREELILLQPELLNVLSSSNGKAVNLGLSKLKEIIETKEFHCGAFLDNAQIVLTSESKSVVSSALTLLEKVGRKIPATKLQVTRAVCQAFIHNDESIQQKAAKLILKFYDSSMNVILEELRGYGGSMLMSARKTLGELVQVDGIDDTKPHEIVPEKERRYEAVHEIKNLDELIFLASQAFDNNDPLHIDMLPAAMVNLQEKINGAELHKFEPALQRAYNFVMNDWPSTMGYLDHLLATFFIDVTKIFIRKYPEHGDSLAKIHRDFESKDRENGFKWKWYSSRICELTTWSVQSRDTTYIIHKAILLGAYGKIASGLKVPMLSTPTHELGYIDPVTLVSRLAQHEQPKVVADNVDFQLAISRIAPFNHTEALAAARNSLSGETLGIIEFVLRPDTRPVPSFATDSLWFIAGITKSPNTVYEEFNKTLYATLPRSLFTGDVQWKTFTEHSTTTQYNFRLKKNEEVPHQRNVLKLTLNPSPNIWREPENTNQSIISKVKNFFAAPKAFIRKEPWLLYEYLSLKAQYVGAEPNDIQRFIYLFPSNPNPVLTLITARSLHHGTFFSEADKRLVTKALEAILPLQFKFSTSTNLFISACLIASDKTVKSLAAELWIKGVSGRHAESSEIGRMIGTHLSVGYAPLKRLTDLIAENLLKISSAHNSALQEMIEAIIEHLPFDPPVGTKRLIELYSEVLALNSASVISPKMKARLQAWSGSATMKKAIGSIS